MTTPENAGSDYDVVISGASLAGSAAAILLARRGARVALLERRSDPAAYRVLCTHNVHASAYPVLDELGLLPAIERAGAVPNTARWYTRWGWIEPTDVLAGPGLPSGYNLRRSVLDPMIRARAAQTPGVELLLGHQVTGLVREAGRTVGVRVSTPQGERELRGRLVVGADGRDSAVAKFAGVPARAYENARFGYLAYYRDLPLPDDMTRAWFLEPDMAYAFPNDDGVTVVAVLPHKKRLPGFRADLEGSFDAFVRALPGAPDIDSAERISKIIGMLDYPLREREPIAPGIAFIGDAALTGDPVWGSGCGWALQSAKWLAEAVAPAVTGRGDLDPALAEYARTHRERMRRQKDRHISFATGRPLNPLERLMFAAAARDESMARHMHRFQTRAIGPLRFLNPVALARAAAVNLRSGGPAVPHVRPRRGAGAASR
ncbi:NAD(P)/FAD-dependent oxidoreductase [Streptomyces rubellomurinus]|uniref:NAD(P)/FAD-dependent oxidoreductase n=1 Tax=Streptomyces rubellomurinus (strain ATCC 31215) TaxID=359131 RepID=UPI0005F1C796|nr:NAD(P)/FAD-dependent oxidoreductase [Streptomyces rubellomurinus]